MAYLNFKDLSRRTAAHRVLRDKAFNTAKNPKHDGYQRGLFSMVYKFFDKNTAGSGVKNEFGQNKELTEELYKLVIRKFEKQKVNSPKR